MFSGFLKCVDCGKSITRSQSGKNIYYACSIYKNRSRTACTMHSIIENTGRGQDVSPEISKNLDLRAYTQGFKLNLLPIYYF